MKNLLLVCLCFGCGSQQLIPNQSETNDIQHSDDIKTPKIFPNSKEKKDADSKSEPDSDLIAIQPVMVGGAFLTCKSNGRGEEKSSLKDNSLVNCGIYSDENTKLDISGIGLVESKAHYIDQTIMVEPTFQDFDTPWHFLFDIPNQVMAIEMNLQDLDGSYKLFTFDFKGR